MPDAAPCRKEKREMTNLRASQLKGNNRCYKRREYKIELQESRTEVFRRTMFIRRLLKNWFLSKELRNREPEVLEAIDLINKAANDENFEIPEEKAYICDAVKSILRTDGNFDVNSGDIEGEEAIKALLAVKLASRKSYIPNVLETKFMDLDFETMATRNSNESKFEYWVLRYLSEEQGGTTVPSDPRWTDEVLDQERSKEIFVPLEMETVDLFGMEVAVRPDIIKIDHHAHVIESVKFGISKPKMTKTGKKKDESALTSLEMYALWLCAKGRIPNPDEEWEVKASVYYMGKNDETARVMRDKIGLFIKTGAYDGYFTCDSKDVPIVSLSEVLVPGAESDVMKMFEPQVEEYRLGEECSGDTCDQCDFAKFCNYNPKPLASEEVRGRKSVTDLDLSKEQEDVVFHRNGIARVNAGAGAGKTLVMALRIAFMLSEGYDPAKILIVSFTNAAAKELKERIVMYCEDLGVEVEEDQIRCMTFNSFGNEIVQKEYEKFGFSMPPRLIDDIEKKKYILQLLDENHIAGLDYANIMMSNRNYYGALPFVSQAFSLIKRNNLSSYDEKELYYLMRGKGGCSRNSAYKKILTLFDKYDELLTKKNLIEFDDQERLLFDLLQMDPYYFDSLEYEHIVIDEFQDTSDRQLELVRKLIECSCFKSLVIVGDDSQSIYSFRGACPENLINFNKKIEKDGEDFTITENHRSTPEILAFANSLNALNRSRVDKDLKATRESGKPVVVKGFHKPAEEYEWIANLIKEKVDAGTPKEDIAVLTYTKTELGKVAGALASVGVESVLCAPQPMLENSRVQGIIAFAKAYEDPRSTQNILVYRNCLEGGTILDHDDADLETIVSLGKDEIHELKRAKNRVDAFDEMVDKIADDDPIAVDLAERLKRFRTTADKIDYVDQFIKFEGEEKRREGKYPGVVLSTAHSSKGLEWPIIINSVTKYDDGTLNVNEMEERRRLFFVSATRARDELYVTGQYKAKGNKKDGYAYNQFLSEACNITGTKYEPRSEAEIKAEEAAREKAKARVEKENKKAAEKSAGKKPSKTPVAKPVKKKVS